MRHALQKFLFTNHPLAEFVGFLHHLDLHRRDAGNHCFADSIHGKVIPQDDESTEIPFLRNPSPQHNLILELIEIDLGEMNRLIDAHDRHARQQLAGLILYLHDHRGLMKQIGVGMQVELARMVRFRGVNKGVPVIGPRMKRLA